MRRVLAVLLSIAVAAIVWSFLRTGDERAAPALEPATQERAAAPAVVPAEIVAPSSSTEPVRAVAPVEPAPDKRAPPALSEFAQPLPAAPSLPHGHGVV